MGQKYKIKVETKAKKLQSQILTFDQGQCAMLVNHDAMLVKLRCYASKIMRAKVNANLQANAT